MLFHALPFKVYACIGHDGFETTEGGFPRQLRVCVRYISQSFEQKWCLFPPPTPRKKLCQDTLYFCVSLCSVSLRHLLWEGFLGGIEGDILMIDDELAGLPTFIPFCRRLLRTTRGDTKPPSLRMAYMSSRSWVFCVSVTVAGLPPRYLPPVHPAHSQNPLIGCACVSARASCTSSLARLTVESDVLRRGWHAFHFLLAPAMVPQASK